MLIERTIRPEVEKALFKGKVVVIYGPRQVGKTTLVKLILEKHKQIKTAYFNCDEADVRAALTDKNFHRAEIIFADNDVVLLDEPR